MTDRLVVDLDAMPLSWPLDNDALEDLRWYLEDYLTAPFGVYGDRGSGIEARLADWGGRCTGRYSALPRCRATRNWCFVQHHLLCWGCPGSCWSPRARRCLRPWIWQG